MADDGGDQDKSETATPFKLRRAREKGSVARGIDLSFFAGLASLAVFLSIAGAAAIASIAQMMHRTWQSGIALAGDPQQAVRAAAASYWAAFHPMLLFGATVFAVVLLFELVQLRGFMFSTQPLKPDFNRINPAKGLKRLFSMRMLKEALKSIVKMALYATVTVLVVRAAIEGLGASIVDARSMSDALRQSGFKLLWAFVGLALLVAVVDQIIARGEFAKQMRMSRREVTRESKEREGDPRLKNKRKQFHAEFAQRNAGMAAVAGSDMLVVNPEHVAVALRYDRAQAAAPVVRAKARDLHALAMRRQAARYNVPILENRVLARALFAECEPGQEIGPAHYHAVADLYFELGKTASDDRN